MGMRGHRFEVLHVHDKTGEIDVRWDGINSRVITCRIPFDAAGHVLPDAEFKVAIMKQCLDRLEHWDRTDQLILDDAHAKLGRKFDVTEAFMFRNVDQTAPAPEDGFSLEDHV